MKEYLGMYKPQSETTATIFFDDVIFFIFSVWLVVVCVCMIFDWSTRHVEVSFFSQF